MATSLADDFTYADGNVPNPPWTTGAGVRIATGQMVTSSSGAWLAVHQTAMDSVEQEVSLAIGASHVHSGTIVGPAARLSVSTAATASSSYYWWRYRTTSSVKEVQLFRVTNGTEASLIASKTNNLLAIGDVMTLLVSEVGDGTTRVTGKINGVTVQEVVDAAPLASGSFVGVRLNGTSCAVDNWSAATTDAPPPATGFPLSTWNGTAWVTGTLVHIGA